MNYQYHAGRFSLASTLTCGQCFRFIQNPDESFTGVVGKRVLTVRQDGERLTFFDTTETEFHQIWAPYFGFDRDYEAIYRLLCKDEAVHRAYNYAGEIHILKQDSWEALCSFIISQNNNIPRIIGIIERLCQRFGEPLTNGCYSFPTAERLASLTLEELAPLRAGFRAKYILDAAQKITRGEVSLRAVKEADMEESRRLLMQICGVGPKVAECALLFGFGKDEAFPVDVWMKRVLESYYPNGFPEALKPYGGVAQQVLFHYIRHKKR